MHLINPADLEMQEGDSDNVIQFLKHQAERGDVESQVCFLHINMTVSAKESDIDSVMLKNSEQCYFFLCG